MKMMRYYDYQKGPHEDYNQSSDYYDNEYYFKAASLYKTHLKEWQARSEETRMQSKSCLIDQSYGPAIDEKLDFFPAETIHRSSKSPLIVFFHGGNWCRLDKRDHSFIANILTKMGIAVAIPNYTLCPKGDLGNIIQQVASAMLWLYQNTDKLKLDPSNIVVCGHSAGGHLAAMLTTIIWPRFKAELPFHLVKAGFAISGLFDLNPIRLTPVLQKDLKLTPELVNHCSPIRIKAPFNTVFTAAVGELETNESKHQTELLEKAWSSQVVQSLVIPGKNHCSILECLTDKTHPLLHQLWQLIDDAEKT